MATNVEIRKQVDFCDDLSKRVYTRTRGMDVNDPWNNKHYQIYQDIVRLRRELLILEKMIEKPWGNLK